MKIVSAKKLSEALSKAQGVGLVEERFNIGDCEVVLRNLRPDEYEAIITDTKDMPDLAFTNAYQKAHICRSIVEINGVDLRDVRFVEADEDDPKTGKQRTIKLELHTYLEQHVLSTWSKEAIFTAYRKVADVVTMAEDQAKKGIVFRISEEAPEDKFRRLLGELHETEEDMPYEVIARALDEYGYAQKTTPEEAKAVDDRLSKIAEGKPGETSAPKPAEAPSNLPQPAPGIPQPAPETALQEVLARRVPLNQIPIQVPSVLRTPVATPAETPGPQTRSAKIAAIEGDLTDSAELAGPPVPASSLQAFQAVIPEGRPEVAELSHKVAAINPKEVVGILDQPPAGGINPRFRPTPR